MSLRKEAERLTRCRPAPLPLWNHLEGNSQFSISLTLIYCRCFHYHQHRHRCHCCCRCRHHPRPPPRPSPSGSEDTESLQLSYCRRQRKPMFLLYRLLLVHFSITACFPHPPTQCRSLFHHCVRGLCEISCSYVSFIRCTLC